ncbi:MAG: restriction endonuclease [Candidatus Cryptobacteroides sp.]
MNNYWLHRITGGENALPLASELFKKGMLSIGWSYLSNEDNLSKLKKSWNSFETLFPDHPRNRYNLWRFVYEMSQGDIVVVPSPYAFSLCRVADDRIFTVETIDPELLVDWNGKPVVLNKGDGYLYDSSGRYIDLGFFRKVEIIEKDIPRNKFADPALYARLKMRQTNAQIKDLRKSIEDAVEKFRENKPINLKEALLEESTPKVLEMIRNMLNPGKFEDLVGWYLEALGGRIETPYRGELPAGEGDADRVAYFDRLGLAIMVQVKKHDGMTDDWAVTQIKSYAANHDFGEYATSQWVISSGDGFSDKAKQLAQEEGIRLIDGPEFARMILETGIADLSF